MDLSYIAQAGQMHECIMRTRANGRVKGNVSHGSLLGLLACVLYCDTYLGFTSNSERLYGTLLSYQLWRALSCWRQRYPVWAGMHLNTRNFYHKRKSAVPDMVAPLAWEKDDYPRWIKACVIGPQKKELDDRKQGIGV